MSSVKLIKNLLFGENMLAIYRTYDCQNRLMKCFIIIHILILILLNTFIVSLELYYLFDLGEPDQMSVVFCGFSIASYVNTLSSIMSGIYFSSGFLSFMKSITFISESFKNDTIVIKSEKRLRWFSLLILTFPFGLFLIRLQEVLKKFKDLNLMILIPIVVSQTFTRMTLLYQPIVFFIVISTVVIYFKCLNRLISIATDSLKICRLRSGLHGECDLGRDQIEGWVELYRDLANCCEKVSICFGRQFSFSLVLTMSNYILLLYQICYMNTYHIPNDFEFKKIILVIISYIIMTMLPIFAGQLICNQELKCHRVLSRLYNTMLIYSNEAEVKLVKDFIRLMKKYPLDIKLMNKLPAGMYMVPAILSFAVNYTIVMLQFHHVI
ncbi:hypothetical protein B5X24_HaOG200748 [Helicoverpa armigera]|nr:hypothetical protein B5X24_HaOG200748 [Helicoverpa armigera]